jgi:hypothetical protein
MTSKKPTDKPRGRPLTGSTARGRPISLRFLPEEIERLKAAVPEGDNLSNWIRRTLLAAAK